MVTAIGLPLLIVKGKFQSLGSMSVDDLETFIPFLVKCSVNRAGAQLINGVPEWWSSAIPFKFPLQKPKGLSILGYRKHLSAIVGSCYWYHDAQYLLPFCAKIAKCPDSVFLQNNEDNTTSIFYVHNTSHIMKFNNENKYYDKKLKKIKNSKRSLLSALPKKPRNILDIYLCEYCDGEFSSHSEVQKHEKECSERFKNEVKEKQYKNKTVNNLRDSDGFRKRKENDRSSEIEVIEHLKPTTRQPKVEKNSFLSYFMLKPKLNNAVDKAFRLRNGMNSTNHGGELSVYDNRNVELSSLCGRKILQRNSKRDALIKIERSIQFNEFYCSTKNTGRTCRAYNEAVDFKVTCKKPKKLGEWTHQYCFNKKQRRSKYRTLKTGLNERSRNLLKQCKKVQVVLHRLNMKL